MQRAPVLDEIGREGNACGSGKPKPRLVLPTLLDSEAGEESGTWGESLRSNCRLERKGSNYDIMISWKQLWRKQIKEESD